MRDLVLWGTAVAFLLAALYTVAVRHEVNDLAREIGVVEERLAEQRRRGDNLELLRENLASPGALRLRAAEEGILPDAEGPR